MPELPEVEVVKRSLKKKIENLVIKKVKINDTNLRYKLDKREISKLIGKKIKKIDRRSKFLIFQMSGNKKMLIHLGMTGKLFFTHKKKKYKTSFYYNLDPKKDFKHDRVIFHFKNSQKLIYNDIRKFGFIKLFDSDKSENFHLDKLGPEPLGKNLDFSYFKNYILGRKRNIKDILMDQQCISGLGNIYVNEILFESKIRPNRKVSSLKDFEINKILKNTKKILKNSIKFGGSSIKDFLSDKGKGSFQQYFNVYGRKGQNCSNVDCNERITRTVISNRATFFCKKCQK